MTSNKFTLNGQNASLSSNDINKITDFEFEDKILRKVERDTFYAYVKANEINLDNILHAYPDEFDILKFNYLIGILDEYCGISISSSLLFLDEDFTKSKLIFEILNDSNKYKLKELLQKRNICRSKEFKNKIEKNKLDLFIEENVDRIDINKDLEISVNGMMLKDKKSKIFKDIQEE
jgi:hypothetical protein